MERAYEKKSEQGEKPIYEPKDFHVIDEIKDPRELAEELREALNPSTTIDEKISFLEEISLGVPRRKKEVSTDDHHQADGRAE